MVFHSVVGQEINGFIITDDYMEKRHIVVGKCIYCGKEITSTLYNLKKAKTHLCSCKEHFSNPLKGKVFGRWTVLEDIYDEKHNHKCLCRCSCDKHTERYVLYSSLVKGLSKSCGCITSENSKNRFVSHAGEKYGYMTIIKDYILNGKHICDCVCDCGNKKSVLWEDLRNGSTKSCGHYHAQRTSEISCIDHTDKTYGNLKVLGKVDPNSWGNMMWKCYCSLCNREAIMSSQALVNGATSCGCENIATRGSKEELEIKEYIKSLCGQEGQKVRILDGKEIDLYYPDYKIGIEYNGSIFHATVNGLYDSKPKNYHQQKFLLAKEKGIHLISIFDVDWQNNRERIKRYLSFLFLPKRKIMARKCQLLKLPDSIAWDFVDKWHLQGANKNTMKINYGLYSTEGKFKNLVAVMSFGIPRLKKQQGKEYELHRYCVADNYTIVGGAEKLLHQFEVEYAPEKIISYSDNDYFIGGIYSKLGFKNVGQSTPRYYWYKQQEVLKREQCQLKYLREKYSELYKEAVGNKEDYIMANLGYCKVYRSGNTKWVK